MSVVFFSSLVSQTNLGLLRNISFTGQFPRSAVLSNHKCLESFRKDSSFYSVLLNSCFSLAAMSVISGFLYFFFLVLI